MSRIDPDGFSIMSNSIIKISLSSRYIGQIVVEFGRCRIQLQGRSKGLSSRFQPAVDSLRVSEVVQCIGVDWVQPKCCFKTVNCIGQSLASQIDDSQVVMGFGERGP